PIWQVTGSIAKLHWRTDTSSLPGAGVFLCSDPPWSSESLKRQLPHSGRYRTKEVKHAGIGWDLQIEIEKAVHQQAGAADERSQSEGARPVEAPALDIAEAGTIDLHNEPDHCG